MDSQEQPQVLGHVREQEVYIGPHRDAFESTALCDCSPAHSGRPDAS